MDKFRSETEKMEESKINKDIYIFKEWIDVLIKRKMFNYNTIENLIYNCENKDKIHDILRDFANKKINSLSY